ncbi:NADH:flavin oxidoreductase/NADH oxidase [Geobacter metallireducens RCH3]|uniref:NADPH-dependent enal/enone/nitroreductase, Oye family n=1 Tax=Geobacter metallireducens (strain ATCC 53774 / DSM 7210 / GS-15) TaxID=269799 RepID=Q39SH8_GEOMG|nr:MULTISPECIES: NADH:flavin oxidoreductase/NADH oxidase [Geobacter]ABB32796.1 NADPH-dependent enal/enone/nitroreductase, Oye family [Geobacter metallireducens GS-15]EHP86094.1 NADH:flavin oxidoreductase/NADH oxidase [Geobacter metallireducens RCH3]MBT1075704.1 NADH:flavin oxidoreductase/NADH oxidase [Geobacter grbiciae]
MSALFTPFTLRSVTFRNRIFVSPMCQYSSLDGMPTDWHLVHLGSRAVGGAGLVMVEATAVSPEGRISPDDSGIWDDRHGEGFAPITRFIAEQGAVPGIQLAHAGRKASTDLPWRGGLPLGPEARGWQPVAPSPRPFAADYPVPRELTVEEMDDVVSQFRDGAQRALAAGFQVVEIHMAHGYLLHEFLSPLSNRRTDDFGGSLENRIRLPLRVTRAVREVWPADLPLFVRISATDWVEGGWDLDQSVVLARKLREAGVDLVDCSAGFLTPDAVIPFGSGYQTPFATAIRREAGIPTGTVGFITDPAQAEQIVATGLADAVLLAREMLRDPYWPLHAARSLGVNVPWPPQYERAKLP